MDYSFIIFGLTIISIIITLASRLFLTNSYNKYSEVSATGIDLSLFVTKSNYSLKGSTEALTRSDHSFFLYFPVSLSK